MVLMTTAAHVLVVDDSATSRVAIEKQLTRLGCCVHTAKNGEEALVRIAETDFDLVLLDCFMPVMDGFAVAASVRADERISAKRHLPLIAISGDSDDAHIQLCLNGGMDGVLAKPLPAAELAAILAMWCGQPGGVTDVADLKSVDLPALFKETSREDYVLLDTAVNAGDNYSASRLVHRMKGAALTMRADAMVATLKRIEATLAASGDIIVLQADMASLLQHIDAL